MTRVSLSNAFMLLLICSPWSWLTSKDSLRLWGRLLQVEKIQSRFITYVWCPWTTTKKHIHIKSQSQIQSLKLTWSQGSWEVFLSSLASKTFFYAHLEDFSDSEKSRNSFTKCLTLVQTLAHCSTAWRPHPFIFLSIYAILTAIYSSWFFTTCFLQRHDC